MGNWSCITYYVRVAKQCNATPWETHDLTSKPQANPHQTATLKVVNPRKTYQVNPRKTYQAWQSIY